MIIFYCFDHPGRAMWRQAANKTSLSPPAPNIARPAILFSSGSSFHTSERWIIEVAVSVVRMMGTHQWSLIQHWIDAGTSSSTMCQHQFSIDWWSRVCWNGHLIWTERCRFNGGPALAHVASEWSQRDCVWWSSSFGWSAVRWWVTIKQGAMGTKWWVWNCMDEGG